MDRLLNALNTPVFVFTQATLNKWGAGIVVLAVGLLIIGLVRSHPARRGLWWAAVMPAPWLLLALGAGWNWAPSGHHGNAGPVLTGLVLLMLGSTLAVSVMAILRVERGRLIIAALSAINGWFACIGGLLSLMIVSGSWM